MIFRSSNMKMLGVLMFVMMFVVISRGQMMMSMGDFSGMMDSFKDMEKQFEKMKNMKPWYEGPNACSSDIFKDDPLAFGDSGSVPFEMCQENGNTFKRVCTSSVVVGGKAKERVRIYQCCSGSVGKYVDGWMQCVK